MAGVHRVNWLSGSCASKSNQVGMTAGQCHVPVGDQPFEMHGVMTPLVWAPCATQRCSSTSPPSWATGNRVRM
eukprot:gene13179-biopygen16528